MSVPCSPLTNDTLFDGRLICRQFRQGYRFSVDAVLAAHFCSLQAGDNVLDLGCGCGVIGLIIAFRSLEKGIQVTGFEFQEDLAMLAQDNILANHLESNMSIIHGDLRKMGQYVSPETYDLVVCNPPYGVPGTGRISPGGQRARARHEIDATLKEIVEAAFFSVKNRGRVVFVYPASRIVSLVYLLKLKNLEPKRFQPIYSYPGAGEASLVLVESMKNGGEDVQFLDPLYIYTEKNGPYSVSMQKMYT